MIAISNEVRHGTHLDKAKSWVAVSGLSRAVVKQGTGASVLTGAGKHSHLVP